MKITDAKVIVCCPSRNFVTLKVTTDEGVCGLGDAALNGREQAVRRRKGTRAATMLRVL
jgi:mannonate dehydratase